MEVEVYTAGTHSNEAENTATTAGGCNLRGVISIDYGSHTINTSTTLTNNIICAGPVVPQTRSELRSTYGCKRPGTLPTEGSLPRGGVSV